MRRKSPYSLVNVKDISVEALAVLRPGERCVAGVDVAKRELVVCLHWPDRSFDRPWRVVVPGQLGLLMERLGVLGSRGPLVSALESTGTYGDVFRQACGDAGLAVERVSSKAVKDHSETFDGVPSQHDGKDAAVIGELCAMGKASRWDWEDGAAFDQELGYQVRKLDLAQRIKQMHTGQLEALLARHWPEAGGLLALGSATLARALVQWGGPSELALDGEAAGRLAFFGGPFLSEEKIRRVIASAGNTAGVRMNQWQKQALRDTGLAIQAQRRVIRGCKLELKRLTRGHGVIGAQLPALGLMTSCVLWLCLGDVKNYPSAGAYRKAMGLNLKEHSSGVHKGRLSLSKRGNRLARKWIFFSGLRWMKDARVKGWVQRKKARDGGRGMKAAVGVMRRLALAGWHVGHGEAFDAGRLFPGIPTAAGDQGGGSPEEGVIGEAGVR